jgi:hypothetical protein
MLDTLTFRDYIQDQGALTHHPWQGGVEGINFSEHISKKMYLIAGFFT